MAFSRLRRRGGSGVPTDSLSDIAFLLIIFFILTTSIRKLTGYTTEMPSAEKSSTKTQEVTPTVTMSGGTMLLNDKEITMDELRQKLQALNFPAKPPNDRVVLLDASEDVSYQRYFEVMALVTALKGVVGILTDEEVNQ